MEAEVALDVDAGPCTPVACILSGMFARWGRFVYRLRWATLVVFGAAARPVDRRHPHRWRRWPATVGFGANLRGGSGRQARHRRDPARSRPRPARASRSSSAAPPWPPPTRRSSPPCEHSVAPLALRFARDRRRRRPTTCRQIQQSSSHLEGFAPGARRSSSFKDDSVKAQKYIARSLGEIHPAPCSYVATGQVPINHRLQHHARAGPAARRVRRAAGHACCCWS